MNPAAPVTRIDMGFLARDTGLPYRLAVLPASDFSNQPHFLFQTASQVLETKGETWLLDDLPEHRFTRCGKAFLQPVMACHEIINAHPRTTGVSNRQRMGDDPGALARVGVGEPALIGIDATVASEIIEIADDPLASPRLDDLDRTLGKAVFDQTPLERFEKPATERMLSAATFPGGAMQRLQSAEPALGFGLGGGFAQLQRAVRLEMPQRAAQLLAGIGAEHRVEPTVARGEKTEVERIRWPRDFVA